MRVQKLELQRHLAGGMCRARQAGVIGADGHLYLVERSFRQARTTQVLPGYLSNGPVHGLVVVGGGDNEVGPFYQVVRPHLIVVNERAPRCLYDAYAFADAGAVGQQLSTDRSWSSRSDWMASAQCSSSIMRAS